MGEGWLSKANGSCRTSSSLPNGHSRRVHSWPLSLEYCFKPILGGDHRFARGSDCGGAAGLATVISPRWQRQAKWFRSACWRSARHMSRFPAVAAVDRPDTHPLCLAMAAELRPMDTCRWPSSTPASETIGAIEICPWILRLVSHTSSGVRRAFTPRQPSPPFACPAWTPASYLFADYVRHLGIPGVWQGQWFLGEPSTHASANALVPRRVGPASCSLALVQLGPDRESVAVWPPSSWRDLPLDTDQRFSWPWRPLPAPGGRSVGPPSVDTFSYRKPCPALVPFRFNSDGSWLLSISTSLIDTRSRPSPWVLPFRGCAARPHRWVSWEERPADQARSSSRFPSLLRMWPPSVRPACDLWVKRCLAAPDTSSFSKSAGSQWLRRLSNDRSTVCQFSRQGPRPKPDGYRRCCS